MLRYRLESPDNTSGSTSAGAIPANADTSDDSARCVHHWFERQAAGNPMQLLSAMRLQR